MIKTIILTNVLTNINIDDVKDEIKDEIKDEKEEKHIQITISNTKQIIKKEKEKKKRMETNTWNINEEDLLHKSQLESLHNHEPNIITHVKSKLSGYRHQDIIKNKFNEDEFVSLRDTMDLLKNSNLLCCYCSDNVYLLYEYVRESKQWSLDRINNDIGHNKGNLVIACLECNLKRRRTNKDAFMFTKNLVINKI